MYNTVKVSINTMIVLVQEWASTGGLRTALTFAARGVEEPHLSSAKRQSMFLEAMYLVCSQKSTAQPSVSTSAIKHTGVNSVSRTNRVTVPNKPTGVATGVEVEAEMPSEEHILSTVRGMVASVFLSSLKAQDAKSRAMLPTAFVLTTTEYSVLWMYNAVMMLELW